MGSLLKNNMIGSNGAKPCRFQLSDIRIEASAIIQQACDQLDEAKKEASRIIDKAREEAEKIREDAGKRGFDDGYKLGLKDGVEKGKEEALAEARLEFARENQNLRDGIENVITVFLAEREHLLAQSKQELLALAIAISARITHKHIDIDPELAIDNLQAAVDLIAEQSKVVVKMNPSDIDRFELLDPEVAKTILRTNSHIEFEKDDSVEPGGCILQTRGGEVDGQIKTQLRNIVQQLIPSMQQTANRWIRETEKNNDDI